MKRLTLLLSSLLLLSISSKARMHFEPDNSTVVDSLKMNRFVPNHIMLNDSVVNFGKLFLKTPYHYGSPGISSFDCSGFTSHVYRNFGYNLGHSSSDQAKQFDSIDRTQLKAGDLVFFSGRRKSKHVGHVGIVVSAKENGEFDFIHAAVHSGVTISNSNEEYYTKRFVKASRVIGANQLLAISTFISKSENHLKDTIAYTPAPVIARSQTIKKVVPAEYHHVKSGETLSSISKKYGMSVAELKRRNNIKGNKLSLKQSLMVKDEETVMEVQTIPSSVNTPTSLAENSTTKDAGSTKADRIFAANQSNTSHSVKKGETLFSISKIYNISIDELKKINNIIKGKIHPGQHLKITQPVNEGMNESLAKVEQTPKSATHKVISGESLFSIAKTYNIPVDKLMSINNIKNANIHAGQELKLEQVNEAKTRNIVADMPDSRKDAKVENKEKTITHIIRKGENLGSIAKNNNTTVEELKRINNLSDSKIHQGQEIKLSQDNDSKNKNVDLAETDKKQKVKIENKDNTLTYKVKKGESLGNIALANNISVDDLKRINNLLDNKIKSGQELKLSQPLEKNKRNSVKLENESSNIQHKVKSGESFYTIAKLYGCTVEELKNWNRKSGNKIKVGEKITVIQKVNKKDLSLVE